MTHIKNNQSGVTLVELMIATLVFSVVLLIIMSAFLFVSNDYIKGYVEAQTQETTRAIMQQVTQNIQLSSATDINTNEPVNGGTYRAICIGNQMYTFQLDQPIGSAGPAHALLVTNTCSSSTTPDFSGAASGKELLRNHMRVGDFYVTANPDGTYTVNLTVAYGDKSASGDILTVTKHTDDPNHTYYSYSCPQLSIGGQFCAVSTVTATIAPRVSGN